MHLTFCPELLKNLFYKSTMNQMLGYKNLGVRICFSGFYLVIIFKNIHFKL